MNASGISHGALMDRVYRHQRHFYDATRKFYLLGRDPMLKGLKPPQGGHVLEVGCGTARNLVAAAELYPSCRFYGFDISGEMLRSAGRSVARAGLERQIRLALSDASRFDPQRAFGRASFDRIYVSYAVSMIPEWKTVLADAIGLLSAGGELHVVDFGDLAGHPRWVRAGLSTWLRWYHVTPRAELADVMETLARRHGGAARRRVLHRGFAIISVVRI